MTDNRRKNRMRKVLGIGGLTLATAILGYLTFFEKVAPIERPKKENYTARTREVADIRGIYNRSMFGTFCFEDLDGDRKVDLVRDEGLTAHFIAPGYKEKAKEKGFRRVENASVMTSATRDAATRIFQGIQDFGYEGAMQKYEEQIQRGTQ
jgi:hypothetical protein